MPHRPSRRYRARAHPRTSVVPHVLVGMVVVYALCLAAFTLLHYDGSRPGAGGVVRDFHAYLGLGPSRAEARSEPTQLRPLAPPPPTPEPAPTPVVKREPSRLDGIRAMLRRVERDAPKLRNMNRGPAFEEARLDLLGTLTDARDVLNEVLDADPGNDRANGLWDDMQYLMAALRKF